MKTDLYSVPTPAGYVTPFQLHELSLAKYAHRQMVCVVVNMSPQKDSTPLYVGAADGAANARGQPVSGGAANAFYKAKLRELLRTLEQLSAAYGTDVNEPFDMLHETRQRVGLARRKARELRDYLGEDADETPSRTTA